MLVLSQHIETSLAVSSLALGGFGYLLKDRVLAVLAHAKATGDSRPDS